MTRLFIFLRKQGLQIESIKERNLRGSTDALIVALAQEENKVILTHDADFGRILHSRKAYKPASFFCGQVTLTTLTIFKPCKAF